MSRKCSQCGNNGHNFRTCTDSAGSNSGGGASNGIMLFGVRLTEGGSSFRKSASMSHLSQFDHEQQHQDSNTDAGYASDDVVHASGRSRKRGVPWTEDEHRLFLLGLQKVGKGDWRGISRNFVKTRTPTQLASHAQKYFLRQHNQSRRSSLFDITTDKVMESSKMMDKAEVARKEAVPPTHPHSHMNRRHGYSASNFPMMTLAPVVVVAGGEKPIDNLTVRAKVPAKPIRSAPIMPVPIPVPPSTKMASLEREISR